MFFSDAESPTTRERTPEGWLRARARVTRSGVLEYDAGEIGVGPSGKTVRVDRPMSALLHKDTLSSVRGAPITIGHPEGGVTPENWRRLAVGNVVGEPSVGSDGFMYADVLIGDREAIDDIEKGVKQLSIGYDFNISPTTDPEQYLTSGGISVNHVAIVMQGRAGEQVAVMDNGGGTDLNETEVTQIVQRSIQDALKGLNGNQSNMDPAALASAVSDAVAKPLLGEMKKISDAQAKSAEEAREAADKKKAEEAADALISKTRDEERGRFVVMTDAAAMLSEDEMKALSNSSTKEILVAACKGIVQDAEKCDEGFLRGALAVAVKNKKDSGGTGDGVGQFGRRGGDEVTKARDAYIQGLTGAWQGNQQSGGDDK